MQRHFLHFLLLCSLSLLVLSGCGGGGGGKPHISGKVPDLEKFTKWSEKPTPGVVFIDGTAQTGSYTSTSVKDEGRHDSKATVAYDKDGNILKITIKTNGTDLAWDTTKGDTIDTSVPGLLVLNDKSKNNLARFVDPLDTAVNWEYQTFGIWVTGMQATSGKFGATSVGATTIGSAIPKTGSATFNGYSGGLYTKDGTTKYVTVSDMKMVANFSNESLTFSTSSTNIAETTATNPVWVAAPDLNMNGTLKYNKGVNKFSGDVTATGLAGTSTGHFYGPKAEELGGVFDLKGSNGTYIGAYGAKQVP